MSCAAVRSQTRLSTFFGFQPDWAGKRAFVDPESPRAFEGRLIGLRWRGKLYTVTSGAQGVSVKVW
jgi:hypothetical protein